MDSRRPKLQPRSPATVPALLGTLLLALTACGDRQAEASPQTDPLVGIWDVDLQPVLEYVGVPEEEREEELTRSFWTWYFELDGGCQHHRRLPGGEEFYGGSWSVLSADGATRRVQLDFSDDGGEIIECDFQLVDTDTLRSDVGSLEFLVTFRRRPE